MSPIVNNKDKTSCNYLDLFKFNLGESKLCISAKENRVFLRTIDNSYVSELNIPVPNENGETPESNPSSTYDERDIKTFVNFKISEQNSNKIALDIQVAKEWEYWYHGSLDDDWHKGESCYKKRLAIAQESGQISYALGS